MTCMLEAARRRKLNVGFLLESKIGEFEQTRPDSVTNCRRDKSHFYFLNQGWLARPEAWFPSLKQKMKKDEDEKEEIRTKIV